MLYAAQYPQPLCVSVITHQVHSGGSVTQGHADPGGCVSDNPMIHLLQSDFICFRAPGGPDASSENRPHPAGRCSDAPATHVTLMNKKQPVCRATSSVPVHLFLLVIFALKVLGVWIRYSEKILK